MSEAGPARWRFATDGELARLGALLEEALFERDLARQIQSGLRREGDRLESELLAAEAKLSAVEAKLSAANAGLSAAEAERDTLRGHVADYDRYFTTLHASRGWKLFQFIRRRLLGRRP